MRVALYARVSTEEQAKHGLSIDTQLDRLRAWASENGHTVVGEYVDPGISARKSPLKRPDLQRLLGDLDRIDAVAFTKLDRWTRNIRGYYQVQEQLDAHRVAWIAVQEDYETVTAGGRFKVNIMLSVAENEADRTAERVKDVLDRKIANGEYAGHNVPLGYSVRGGRLVPNEDADAVRAAFTEFRRTGNISAAMEQLHRLGYLYGYATTSKLLRHAYYAGRYRDNPAYCEPIIPPEEFDEVQALLRRRSVRSNPTGRVYLFSGLLKCAVCGGTMTGKLGNAGKISYRCKRHYCDRLCPNGHHVREDALEEYLLANVVELLQQAAAKSKPRRQQKAPDRAAIARKLDRLKDLYVDGLIDKQTYLSDRERLALQLREERPQHPRRDSFVLQGDLRERYAALPREDRRSLWRSIIDRIVADGDQYAIYFCD